MKTMKQWNNSRLPWGKFAQPGDEVDDEIYDYFLEVLFPRKMTGSGFLVGEPASHNNQGEAMYDAFYDKPGYGFFYGGEMTVDDFMIKKS